MSYVTFLALCGCACQNRRLSVQKSEISNPKCKNQKVLLKFYNIIQLSVTMIMYLFYCLKSNMYMHTLFQLPSVYYSLGIVSEYSIVQKYSPLSLYEIQFKSYGNLIGNQRYQKDSGQKNPWDSTSSSWQH